MWYNAGWYRGGGSAVPLLGQMQTTLTLAATDGKNADDFDNGHVSEDDVIPVITVPVTAPSALAITRRDPHWGITPAPQSPPRTHCTTGGPAPLKMEELQLLRRAYVREIMKGSEKDMWKVFCAVRRETRVCQSAVLRAVRAVVDPLAASRWPKDRRALDKLITRAGGFRSRVIRAVNIDMSDQGIDKPIEFYFVDPIYAWTCTAHHVSRSSPLHFMYQPLYDPKTGERLYGTSVKCGEVLRLACEHVQTRCVCRVCEHVQKRLISILIGCLHRVC